MDVPPWLTKFDMSGPTVKCTAISYGDASSVYRDAYFLANLMEHLAEIL